MSILSVVKIGKKLKDQRIRRFMTQEDFAKQIGISSRQVGRIEANEVEPRFSTITQIAERLGIDRADLIDEE